MMFIPGKVLEEFTVNGKKVVFRFLRVSDLGSGLKHINFLIRERAYIAAQKPVSRKKEMEWIKKELAEMKKGEKAAVVAEVDGKFSGIAEVWRCPADANRHVSEISIGFSSNRGIGLGKRTIALLEKIARKDFRSKILVIKCYECNCPALGLYRKMGFRQTGKVPKGCNYYGKYMDEVTLVKELGR
jgi:RimJ/RimL family protein N-acetyltransferase